MHCLLFAILKLVVGIMLAVYSTDGEFISFGLNCDCRRRQLSPFQFGVILLACRILVPMVVVVSRSKCCCRVKLGEGVC